MILAANHRSFLDPFVIGCCLPRPIYFVAKQELFENPLLGWFLNCMGAFPVRRGESDEESVETALALLERGEAVVIFPEGTRIRAGSLGEAQARRRAPGPPERRAGRADRDHRLRARPRRLEDQAGARARALRPAAHIPARGKPVAVPGRRGDRAHLALRRPPVGVARRAAAAAQRRGGRRRLDGHRDRLGARARRARGSARLPHDLAGRPAAGRPRERRLPARAWRWTRRSSPRPSARSSSPGVDLVVLAVPCSSLPAAIGQIGARVGERSAVLVASKGLVPPLGTTPSAYVAERVRARAVASLAGPAHAREAIELGASVVVATRDADLRRQLREVLDAGGLTVEATDDVTGAELAACAKNAAALASGAASARGANLAGAAAGTRLLRGARAGRRERRSQRDLRRTGRRRRPGRHGDRRGQPQPARRRAGRRRHAGRQVEATVQQTAESLATVPLLSDAFAREGIDAPITPGCAGCSTATRRPSSGSRACAARPAAEDPRGLTARAAPSRLRNGWTRSTDKQRLDRDFTELYRAHLRDVYSYAYYRIGNHHDAEDLTEQTFLQAYRHFDRAQRESNGRPLRPWLIRIAHNLAANYYRDRSRRPARSSTTPRCISAPHGTEEMVEGREEVKEVLQGVSELPDDRREALIMRFALDMDNREIARALGRSEGATKVLIHRAIKQLEQGLEEAGDEAGVEQ